MKRIAGFSLVELAIVLVIIGLITGGILTGQDLIRASELNSVIADKNKYITAVNTFKLKYNALPGDMTNATAYWGTNASCASVGAGTGTQTCNGNGNGQIGWYIGAGESYWAWQHLGLSGVIPGSFTGAYSGTYVSVVGTNVPASKIANAGWLMFAMSQLNSINYEFGYSDGLSQTRNMLGFGSIRTDYWLLGGMAAITPQEASSIDTKIDDNLPGKGLVTSCSSIYCTCATTGSINTAAYALTVTTPVCSLAFWF